MAKYKIIARAWGTVTREGPFWGWETDARENRMLIGEIDKETLKLAQKEAVSLLKTFEQDIRKTPWKVAPRIESIEFYEIHPLPYEPNVCC